MVIRHAVDIHYAWNYNRDSKIVHNLSNPHKGPTLIMLRNYQRDINIYHRTKYVQDI